MEAKKIAAEKAVESIRDGMIVGLGTGSTAYWAIQKIGAMVKNGLRINAVCTSLATEKLAREQAIPVVPFAGIQKIDLSIDGADEVDAQRNLIKGGGGALLREKIIAFHTHTYLVVVDETKQVKQLGRFPLPIEILSFAHELTLQKLEAFGRPVLRKKEGRLFQTDNGNLIADLQTEGIDDPAQWNQALHSIPGVLETGLFVHSMVSKIFVGTAEGEVKIR